MMIRNCTPKVFDTAHLHGALGRFKRLGLVKFYEDAKACYHELVGEGGKTVPPLEFRLEGETAERYSKTDDTLAHEAGFDSLITAQLFAYLRAISPARVREAANRLFLYRSVEYLDLDLAAKEGKIGTCMFDTSRVTLLVAALDTPDNSEAARLIASAGAVYKWIDSMHILVVLRASGGAAVRKAADLAAMVLGVVSWMGFDEWRAAQVTGPGREVEPAVKPAFAKVSWDQAAPSCNHQDESESAPSCNREEEAEELQGVCMGASSIAASTVNGTAPQTEVTLCRSGAAA